MINWLMTFHPLLPRHFSSGCRFRRIIADGGGGSCPSFFLLDKRHTFLIALNNLSIIDICPLDTIDLFDNNLYSRKSELNLNLLKQERFSKLILLFTIQISIFIRSYEIDRNYKAQLKRFHDEGKGERWKENEPFFSLSLSFEYSPPPLPLVEGFAFVVFARCSRKWAGINA